MATDFSPLSGRDATRTSEPRRFVPTLTEVVHVPEPLPVPLQAALTEDDTAHSADAPDSPPAASKPVNPPPLAVDTEALVARVCASVSLELDDHVRAVVADAMQAQHMLLVQGLRSQLAPMIETLVRNALAAETVHATRQAGESCIQATD
jgi:hypothetical protein